MILNYLKQCLTSALLSNTFFWQVRKTVQSNECITIDGHNGGFAIEYPIYPAIIYHWYNSTFSNVT